MELSTKHLKLRSYKFPFQPGLSGAVMVGVSVGLCSAFFETKIGIRTYILMNCYTDTPP